MKGGYTPTLRVTFGVVSLTISLLLAAHLLGFLPDRTDTELDARKKLCEALAVQLSFSAARNDVRAINSTLGSVVARNDDILSAALRNASGSILAVAGEHDRYWRPPEENRSTPTHVQIPIVHQQGEWGVVELSFTPIATSAGIAAWRESLLGLLAFIGLAGFLFYFAFLRRALRELDPAAVIPERVRAAFDALAEGVLIMDEDERIVLANTAFGSLVGQSAEGLTGRKASELDWRASRAGNEAEQFPWRDAMEKHINQRGVPLLLPIGDGKIRTLMVNGAPILDGKNRTRGALATFDDVTDLEHKNSELQHTLRRLERSQAEVKRQNQELRFLATRDPLTGCLNRRAFFENVERIFERARRQEESLCCIMADIDHFKSINDRYGHAAGDKVIRFVAERLQALCRDGDLVCRYGGEEFCAFLPGLGMDETARLANQLRHEVSDGFDRRFTSSQSLTISLGVAELDGDVKSASDLVNQADMALYTAKASGRNRVIRWDDSSASGVVYRLRDNHSRTSPDTDRSMLVETLDAVAVSQKAEVHRLRQQISQLDELVEKKSMDISRQQGYDEVTNLPKRLLFCDRVSQLLANAQRDGRLVAILYLDIDLFQRMQDTLGPVTGDGLMHQAAKRMAAVVRSGDTVALLGDSAAATISRLATDEFGIALSGLHDVESVTWIIQRIFDALAAPIEINEHEIYVTCSVGVSLYPNDAEDVETLVRHASTARHHAKARVGRNKFVFFAEEMNERSYQQMRLESQLRHAIERDELLLHYQPKVDLRTGQITAVEALVRWAHPEMGIIGPDWFIHIAEHTGLINEIGEWVLLTACRQMKAWLDKGFTSARVAVNLSPIQLRAENLVERINQLLEASELEPRHLELEVTETALLDDVKNTQRKLNDLRSHGIQIAIDDFGTGFSSLSHLRYLVVDCLKIDRSFIADMVSDQNDAALVAAIIAMGHRMGLRVVAEGVETEAQVKCLRELQCDEAQGYLLSNPIVASEVEALFTGEEMPVSRPYDDLAPRRPAGPQSTATEGDTSQVIYLGRNRSSH